MAKKVSYKSLKARGDISAKAKTKTTKAVDEVPGVPELPDVVTAPTTSVSKTAGATKEFMYKHVVTPGAKHTARWAGRKAWKHKIGLTGAGLGVGGVVYGRRMAKKTRAAKKETTRAVLEAEKSRRVADRAIRNRRITVVRTERYPRPKYRNDKFIEYLLKQQTRPQEKTAAETYNKWRRKKLGRSVAPPIAIGGVQAGMGVGMRSLPKKVRALMIGVGALSAGSAAVPTAMYLTKKRGYSQSAYERATRK
jgi:hypothetical protein